MTNNEKIDPSISSYSYSPSSQAGRGLGGGVPTFEQPWQTSPQLWQKLKPLARQMRCEPTPAEKKLWDKLKNKQLLGCKFRRQHTIDRFIVDFYCGQARLIVEVDGSVHEYTQSEDAIRQEFLESLNLRVIRFTNSEVLNSVEMVLEQIAVELQKEPHPPTPSPSTGREGRGRITSDVREEDY
ncbi:endonuclease domain-containing protein [Aerosakkonema funiforme]|uniref:endonuclease domain-containing protein n=1 Tax=Aerosakkonema funiforme TaxID=1246630 RepID=UPI0035BAE456